jgi:hypothetical protein
MHPTHHRQSECAVIQTDANAMKPAISHRLEMQRWMARIGLEQGKIFASQALNFRGQCVKALPKPLRCGVNQAQSVLAVPLRKSASASAAS